MQDNQILTANDLNQIAIDLGAGTFLYFNDGEPYAVTELNNITKELVTKGVLKILDECKCTVNEDNAVTINTGVVVFSDGCKIRIEEAVTIQLSTDVKTYIYVEHDNEFDRVSLVTDTELSEKDYVMLATVEAGVVTDERAYSVARVNMPAEANSFSKELYIPATTQYKRVENSILIPITDTSKVFFSVYCATTFKGSRPFTGNVIATYDAEKRMLLPEYLDATAKAGNSICELNGASNFGTEFFITEENNILTLKVTSNLTEDITVKVFVFNGLSS